MAASSKLFNRYIWLTELIYSAGRITRSDIDRKWSRSSLNDEHENGIPERTFHRWRQEIEELFHIIISCYKPTNTYYIENADEIAHSKTHQWLLNTFAVTNLINESQDIQNRILLEDMPSDSRFLTTIMDAMRDEHVLEVRYKKFGSAEGHVFEMRPYCVKASDLRWYMVGESTDHPGEVRVYALDRIEGMVVTDKHFDLPEDFDGKAYFRDYVGVMKGDAEPQKVKIQAEPIAVNYLRSLPLHHSQVEIERTNEYSVFEYFVAPTYDFIQKLRAYGDEIKVLEPQSLRDEFRMLGWKYTLMYPKVKTCDGTHVECRTRRHPLSEG